MVQNVEIMFKCQSNEQAQNIIDDLTKQYPQLDIAVNAISQDLYVRQGPNQNLHDYLAQREQVRKQLMTVASREVYEDILFA